MSSYVSSRARLIGKAKSVMHDSPLEGEMGGGGPVSDISELLRGVDTDARQSYYRTASSMYAFFAIVIILLLAISVVGLWHGGFYGYVLSLGGVFGLVIVGLWLGLH
jgi:hypothetical protein